MNLFKTFENRVGEAIGTAPQGYTAPFSFKKLARRAAREMEAETYLVDGVDTAPALYTILVSPADDAAMRMLYPKATRAVVDHVKAEGERKGYVFVGEPLARFMVDPALRTGRFAVFAENVNSEALERLRAEEDAYLAGAQAVGIGGAATDLSHGEYTPAPGVLKDIPMREPGQAKPAEPAVAFPVASPALDDSVSMGLDVIPMDFLDTNLDPGAGIPEIEGVEAPVRPRVAAVPSVEDAPRTEPAGPATCLLVDHQSGRTYTGVAPKTRIGRERYAGAIVLRDPNVSRTHAELSYADGRWVIRDLGSTNGTLVNDVDVASQELHDGDVITIGLISLEFREN